MSTLFKKLVFFFERLSSRPQVGGLHIADSSVYYVSGGDAVRPLSLRLPPGVVAEGKILDIVRFRETLGQLRAMIDSRDRNRAIPVIVSLPSAAVYTQSFMVPNVGKEQLAESAELNLRMISPLPHGTAYRGWQLVSESGDSCEVLGAFADKRFIDETQELLRAEHFNPIVFEFPGLSLSRLVSRFVRASQRPMLVFFLSSDGVNLFLQKNESLSFDYFRSWRSMQGESREIPRIVFDSTVAQEVQKVINFTLSKFQDAPEQVILIAPGYERELQSFIRERFALPVVPLELKERAVQPAWYVALGAALRGQIDRTKDTAISLAPLSSRELFYEEQLFDFVSLWRGITGAVLALFLFLFAGASYLFTNQLESISRQLEMFSDVGQQRELGKLQEKAVQFNALVNAIRQVRSTERATSDALARLDAVRAKERITLTSLVLTSLENPIEFSGDAPDYDTVLRFKETLLSDGAFTDMNLPISHITAKTDGSVSFSMTFRYRGASSTPVVPAAPAEQ